MTLAELVEGYCTNLDDSSKGQHEVVRSLVAQCFGGEPAIGDLFTREAIAKFSAWLQTKPYAWRFGLQPLYRAPHTVNQKVSIVCSWWADAFAEGLVNVPPPSRRQRSKLTVKTGKRSPRAWTEAEYKSIIAHVSAAPESPGWSRNHMECLLHALYYTGARIAGLLGCTLDSLNETHIYLPAEESKTDQEKPCDVPGWLIDRLRGLPRASGDKRLFPLPFTVPTLRGHLKRILTAAGLPAGKRDLFHKIRRTSGTHVAKAGGLAAAQEHLGHASMATTMGYVDVTQLGQRTGKMLPDFH